MSSGRAAEKKIPVGSVIIRWNKWRVGQAIELLKPEIKRSMNTDKDIWLLTPDKELIHFSPGPGLTGFTINPDPTFMEKAEAQEWLKKSGTK